MKILLYRTVFAINEPVKEVQIQGNFEDYYLGLDQINEKLLLQNLPKSFIFPLYPHEVSIIVEEPISEEAGRSLGVTGQRNLSIFKDYGKNWLEYSLLFCREI